jgi:hypothetical protein
VKIIFDNQKERVYFLRRIQQLEFHSRPDMLLEQFFRSLYGTKCEIKADVKVAESENDRF